MREIKFRCWVKDAEDMVYPERLTNINSAFPSEDEERVMMQYTGLKDKNGTPIFENDIVEHYGEVFEVVFDEGAFLINGISTRINPDGSEYTVRGDLLMNQDDVLVVIGNRFENPELLEEESK